MTDKQTIVEAAAEVFTVPGNGLGNNSTTYTVTCTADGCTVQEGQGNG